MMPVSTSATSDVEQRADRERAQDADGHVALRVLGLLRGGRDRVEADVGEEDDGRAADDAAPAEVAEVAGVGRDEGVRVVAVTQLRIDRNAAQATMKATTIATLTTTMTVLTLRRFLDADDEQRRDGGDDRDGAAG